MWILRLFNIRNVSEQLLYKNLAQIFVDSNVWSLGDASSLPTSKTAAAITAQAPVLVRNLVDTMNGRTSLQAKYDGYTSCPVCTIFYLLVQLLTVLQLLTGKGQLLLAE